MDASTIGLIAFGAVLLLLALRVPIAFALASVATIATFVQAPLCRNVRSEPPLQWCSRTPST